MLVFFEEVVELLYVYKTSSLYSMHFLLMIILMVLYVYLFLKQREIQNKEQHPPESRFAQKVDYVDYEYFVKNNTNKEVGKLERSHEFQNYMELRQNPNSRYYAGKRNYDDVEEIVLSDDSDEFESHQYRKNI